MSWKEFTASVIGDLAWPATLVVVVIIFRGRFGDLIGRVTDWEGLGQKVSFGKKLAEAEAKADDLKAAAQDSLPDPLDDELRELARESEENPSFVLLASWERVMGAVADLVGAWSQAGIPPPKTRSPGAELAWIRKNHALTEGVQETIGSLRQLRNAVAHGQHRPLPGEAVTYAEIAGEVTDILRSAARKPPT